MRHTTKKEIEAVLRLDGPARFDHFVKRVVDSELAWGLWKNGWALMAKDDGTQVFPLWPAREYAELFRTGEWAQYDAEEIPLTDLMDELLPKLEQRGVLPGVFPTPGDKGVTPTAKELRNSLEEESENTIEESPSAVPSPRRRIGGRSVCPRGRARLRRR
jgi:hypothetical protein